MQKSRGEIIVNLMEELDQMPGYKVHQDLDSLEISIYSFQRNYNALMHLLLSLAQKNQSLIAARNHDKLMLTGKDAINSIHNYVNSAMSILEHTKNLVDGKKNISTIYWDKRKLEFDKDIFACFVKELREYCYHNRSANITLRTTFPNNEPVIKVIFTADDLLAHKDWKGKTEKYIRTLGSIDVQDIATNYLIKVMKFYEWFRQWYLEIYTKDYEKFFAKNIEIQILKIEDRIDSYVPKVGDIIVSKHNIFLGIFQSEDFDQLERPSLNVCDQPELAIKLLEKYFPTSGELKQKINSFYQKDEL